MKNILKNINKLFDNKVRLGIMAALMVNDYLDFNSLKDLLGVTDGNLASHIKALEKATYIKIEKQFIEKKPNTKYSITQLGALEFKKHITALEKLITKFF